MFKKNFVALAKANVIAQLLTICFVPIISRLFSPSDYGILSVYSSLVVLLASVSTLRFDWTIPSSKLNSQAAILFVFGIVSVLIFTLVTSLIFVSPFVWGYAPDAVLALRPYWPLIIVGVLFLSCFNLLKSWSTRKTNLLNIARITWQQAIARISFNLFFGYLSFGGIGLLLSSLIARSLGLRSFYKALIEVAVLTRKTTIKRVSMAWKRYRHRAATSALISLLNTISTNLTILGLAVYYSAFELGILAFSNRLVAGPVNIVVRAIAQSFWSRAAELARTGQYKKLRKEYLYVTIHLSICALLVSTVIFIAAPYTGLLFGENWTGAGIVLMCMIPLFIGTIIVVPTNHLIAIQKEKLQFFADIARLFLITASIGIAIYFRLDFKLAVLLCCSSSLCGYLILAGIQSYQHYKLITKAETHEHYKR